MRVSESGCLGPFIRVLWMSHTISTVSGWVWLIVVDWPGHWEGDLILEPRVENGASFRLLVPVS